MQIIRISVLKWGLFEMEILNIIGLRISGVTTLKFFSSQLTPHNVFIKDSSQLRNFFENGSFASI